MFVFYDFEVFKDNWMAVLIEPFAEKETVIVDDASKLIDYYESHKNDIWVGFNSRHYDQFILKAIILGFNPKEVNDWIIVQKLSGYMFSSLLNKVFLINYDVMPNPPVSLKTLEGFLGNNIKESDVPFDIDRPLTDDEIAETIKYCRHDVEQTINVFLERKNEYDSHIQLIRTFELPMSYLCKTQAQLSAEILNCKKREWDDEFDYPIVGTLCLKKYNGVREWFENAFYDCQNEMLMGGCDLDSHDPDFKKYFYSRNLTMKVCGVPHQFGWGGLHGAPEKPVHRKGLIVHVDVTSYYPSIMIKYNLLTRNSRTPKKYEEIYNHRLALKKAGKKKEQAPYKIVLNATYGICKDKFSTAYDPRNANAICVNGQLMLLDLLEHLEGHCELIQSNTDGLIIQIPDTDYAWQTIDDICYEWEQRTGMSLGFDIIREIWQKDVNNYLWIDEDGKVERKGAYIKELVPLDYDLPIVNKAMVDYMTKGINPAYTIQNCNKIKEFQKLVKLSSKYEYVEHNGKRYRYKCYRVFASKERKDGKIYKCREGSNPAKFAGTSDHAFIVNGNVNDIPVPDKLDRQWYINLTRERLRQYGCD